MMEYESCYVFQPSRSSETRPKKKRRIENPGLQASWRLRREAYLQTWGEKEAKMKSCMSDMNETSVQEITTFIHSAQDAPMSKLPAAIISAGPDIASHGALLEQLAKIVSAAGKRVFVTLISSLATNLKVLLKHLIALATSSGQHADEDDDEEVFDPRRGRARLLNYDLQVLHNAVQERGIDQVVVAFQDCEAFDGTLLSDTIELLGCWKDRIPFALLFGVATSVENFQAKLSRKAVRCLEGQQFDMIQSGMAIEKLSCTVNAYDTWLWLGSGICSSMLSRHRDHAQSLEAFTEGVQYAYMTHFYANALSLFLQATLDFGQVPRDHFEALRNLPSFRDHVEQLVAQREAALVVSLLDSDRDLFAYARQKLRDGHKALLGILIGLEMVHGIQQHLGNVKTMSWSALQIEAFAGQLHGSAWERSLFLSLRKANSDVLRRVLTELSRSETLRGPSLGLIGSLDKVLAAEQVHGSTLRSQEDVHNSTLRTTVVAKKVALSKQKSTLTKGDSAYSKLLLDWAGTLEQDLGAMFVDPKDLVFNEIFIYDSKSPHRDVFTAKPRFAIERALSAPHDYLDCACCVPGGESEEEAMLQATQPATAILYQLYMESGALINASDLRSAFAAILGEGEEGEADEARVSALFQRALAELRYFGLIKGSKRKADHIAKLSWRGL